jgi:hypothetical protein
MIGSEFSVPGGPNMKLIRAGILGSALAAGLMCCEQEPVPKLNPPKAKPAQAPVDSSPLQIPRLRRRVALSDLIAVGVYDAGTGSMTAQRALGGEALKNKISVRIPGPPLAAIHQKQVIVCLQQNVDDTWRPLALDATELAVHTPQTEGIFGQEQQRQSKLLASNNSNAPIAPAVAKLIDALLNENTADDALARLQLMGSAALEPMIRSLSDDRELSGKALDYLDDTSAQDSATVSIPAKTVAEAMIWPVILLSGERYGWAGKNGDSNTRVRAIRAYRVFLNEYAEGRETLRPLSHRRRQWLIQRTTWFTTVADSLLLRKRHDLQKQLQKAELAFLQSFGLTAGQLSRAQQKRLNIEVLRPIKRRYLLHLIQIGEIEFKTDPRPTQE